MVSEVVPLVQFICGSAAALIISITYLTIHLNRDLKYAMVSRFHLSLQSY